jgi:hypothetical protein
MSESTLKGAIEEAAITAEAVKPGVVVLRPFPEGRRYDLVFDVDHTDECHYLPIEELAGRGIVHLRLTPTANRQVIAIKYASEYTPHGAIAQLGERRHGMAEVVGSSPTSSTSRPS